jgi:hypothetical protein
MGKLRWTPDFSKAEYKCEKHNAYLEDSEWRLSLISGQVLYVSSACEHVSALCCSQL